MDTQSDHPEESAPVVLARCAVEAFVREAKTIPVPDPVPAGLAGPAAVFVSIKILVDGEKHLRGCIGTLEPTCSAAAEEVIDNAIRAATEDPRFMPISVRELPDLVYSVDVLAPAEPVADVSDLDPFR